MCRTADRPNAVETRIVRLAGSAGGIGPPFGSFVGDGIESWFVWPDHPDMPALQSAADHIRLRNSPVAFPTETVYGLGADATRSEAVRAIFSVKGRPPDNPLIVHVCDMAMLRRLLAGTPIPPRYLPLLQRFWPGPLTILLPNQGCALAPEVTAGLPTFGVRLPASSLACSLIKLAGTPVAAPSANASTRPSTTTAQHVLDDLAGRIDLVLDGGPCAVGVESTVVDGLCDPPAILRPGGVPIDAIRACPGWEAVVAAYADEVGGSIVTAAPPRAPGMKYKHYSPRARLVLYEPASTPVPTLAVAVHAALPQGAVGLVRTGGWPFAVALADPPAAAITATAEQQHQEQQEHQEDVVKVREAAVPAGLILDVDLGRQVRAVAHGLFAALRELDRRGAATIFVEGVDDATGVGGAVMNRLRKAASEIVRP